MKRLILSAVLLWTILSTAPANAATAAPSTAPATEPARYVVILPDGMEKVTVGSRTAVCTPAIESVVRDALGKVGPVTRPTTEPSDLLNQLTSQRQSLMAEMTADLNIPQDKAADLIDKKLKPSLEELAGIHPPVYVLVATQEQVTAAVKHGWHAPLFYYNQLADYTDYHPTITIRPRDSMDDVVVWAEIKDDSKPADVAKAVDATVRDVETSLPENVSGFAMLQINALLMGFIDINAIEPLKLPASESWFGEGVALAAAAKYTAQFTGLPRPFVQSRLAADSPTHPVLAAQLDLLNGFDPTSIRPEFLRYYQDAVTRKASRVIEDLTAKAGDSAVAKVLTAIKTSPPPDNLALVALINRATGVDLTNDLLPQITSTP